MAIKKLTRITREKQIQKIALSKKKEVLIGVWVKNKILPKWLCETVKPGTTI